MFYYDSVYVDNRVKTDIDMAFLSCLSGSSSDLKFYLDSGINPKRNESESSLLFACIFGKSPECLSLLMKTEPTMNQNVQKNISVSGTRSSGPVTNATELLEALYKASESDKDKICYKRMLKILEKYPAK